MEESNKQDDYLFNHDEIQFSKLTKTVIDESQILATYTNPLNQKVVVVKENFEMHIKLNSNHQEITLTDIKNNIETPLYICRDELHSNSYDERLAYFNLVWSGDKVYVCKTITKKEIDCEKVITTFISSKTKDFQKGEIIYGNGPIKR